MATERTKIKRFYIESCHVGNKALFCSELLSSVVIHFNPPLHLVPKPGMDEDARGTGDRQ